MVDSTYMAMVTIIACLVMMKLIRDQDRWRQGDKQSLKPYSEAVGWLKRLIKTSSKWITNKWKG